MFFTKKPFETKVYSIEYEGTILEISPNWDHTPVINTILKDWTIDKFEFERKHLLENYPLFIQDKILEDISPTLIWIKNYLKK